MNQPIHKILLIRFSSIGDILLTTPVIRQIRSAYPDAEIHFLCKSAYRGLLQHHPELGRILCLEDQSWSELLLMLREQSYDVVLDLHASLRSLRLRAELKPKVYRRLNKHNLQKWWMVQSKSADKHLPHIVDRYQQLFADWGSPVETGLEFHFPQEAHAQLAEQLPDDFICIAFGAKFRTKQIPESLVIELIKGCKSEIVLLGGAAEVKQAEEILEGLDSPSRQGTQNWVGRCSLEESAFILSRSRKLLAADTGMLHMATALGIPSATLWGNTVPEFGMAAYYGTDASEKATHFEVPGLSCRPCSKLGKSSCPKGHWNCMMQQDKVAILGWLNATNSASEATF